MLQILCQLLGTSSLEDVQSWLVSATFAGECGTFVIVIDFFFRLIREGTSTCDD